jgi:hypothetical protein
MTNLVQVAVAGDVAEAEELQSILQTAGIEATFEMAAEHEHGAMDDPPLKILVADHDVDAARDAIEALTEPDELIDED